MQIHFFKGPEGSKEPMDTALSTSDDSTLDFDSGDIVNVDLDRDVEGDRIATVYTEKGLWYLTLSEDDVIRLLAMIGQAYAS